MNYVDVDVCNLAISNLGESREISNLKSDTSPDAKACRRHYHVILEEILRGFVWPFATKVVTLALVSKRGDANHPTKEWALAYRYPSDCLMMQKIHSGIRNDNRQTRVPSRVVADDEGQLILTDMPDAVMDYTSDVGKDAGRWQADFVYAFSLRLAAAIAPRITAGDPFKMGDKAMNLYQMAGSKAMANSANEQQDEDIPESEMLRARY